MDANDAKAASRAEREPSGKPVSRVTPRSRRTFLADTAMGLTGLALGSLFSRDGIVRADAPSSKAAKARRTGAESGPHFEPKARSVIWIFLCGGVSHLESFDPKPALNTFAGKSIDDTPYRHVLDPERISDNRVGGNPPHGTRQ